MMEIGEIVFCLLLTSLANSHEHVPCDVRAWTEAGWVCGLRRWSEGGKIYASFRGVPYAKQPIGELRFKELEPIEPWKHDRDAREEGPVCMQLDEVYGLFATPEYGMSEACIHANIHIPIHALPKTHKDDEKNHGRIEKEKEKEKYSKHHEDNKDAGFEYPLLEYEHNNYEKKTNELSKHRVRGDKVTLYKIPEYHQNIEKEHVSHGYQEFEKKEHFKKLPEHEDTKDDIIYDKPKSEKEKKSDRATYHSHNHHTVNEEGMTYPLFQYQYNNDEKKLIDAVLKHQDTYEKGHLINFPKYDEHVKEGHMHTAPEHQKDNTEESMFKFPKYQDHMSQFMREGFKENVKHEKEKSNQDDHEKRYFWPYDEKPENVGVEKSSQGVQYIIETWPKFHRQMYEKHQTKESNSSQRNKRENVAENEHDHKKKLLPILVFIHGGGFNTGAGDADIQGPEYLVSKDVIVITFNYRLGVFGFLSLNTSSVPGNNGLRDQIALLRWVQRNAKNFGGDPDNVTLMGQSAGATSAHLLSLSDAAKGLFKRLWLSSGTAYEGFYTASPIYAAGVTASFLTILGITSTDPDEIHKELIHMPFKRIVEANTLLQAQYGLLTFSPVVENRFHGVTPVLDKDPEALIAEGRGKEYPAVIGYTTVEAETFRSRLAYREYVSRVTANPRLNLPAGIPFSTPPKVSLALGEKVAYRCFEKEPNLDGIVRCYSEIAFIYQAFRLARVRAQMHAAPTYLYQFSYESIVSLVQKALNIHYKGAAHIEDLNYIFRANSLLDSKTDFPPKDKDDMMRDWMSAFVVNFMYCSDPTCSKDKHKSGWPHVTKDHLVYEDIGTPYVFKVNSPMHKLEEIIKFYDKIYAMSGIVPGNETKLLD